GKYAHSVLTRYRDVLCEVLPKNLFYEGIMNVSCDLATRLAVLYYRCQDELFKLPIQRRDILNASVLINDLSFDARAIIKKFGVHGAFRVVEFRRAIGYDTFALEGGIENALESGTCFTLSDLKINGHDLLEIGVPAGAWMGRILNSLLDGVIDGTTRNIRDDLLIYARRIMYKI
ncbi:MAG: hypothetical protein RSC43_08875, partial [Clostridia bacterium]